MNPRIGFLALWLGFILYAFGFAPPAQSDTFDLIQNLATGQWQDINPLIVALFNLMGLWPMIYACLVLVDGRGQTIPAWPFSLASFGVGAFALLPYLGLRRPNPSFVGEKSRLLSLVESRWTGGAIALGTISLLLYGLFQGDWAAFSQQWQTSRFIHVMSLDFVLLCLLFPALIADDKARRGWGDRPLLWAWTPLLGAIAYLCFRPPLPMPLPDQDDTNRYDDPVRSL
jgi:hypothetical protein